MKRKCISFAYAAAKAAFFAIALLLVGFDGGESHAGQPDKSLLTGAMTNFVPADDPQPVSEAKFKDADGNTLTLADFRGKVLLVNLWATWCAPCKREMPEIDHLQGLLGGDDFKVIILSQDRGGFPKVNAFLEEIGVEHLTPYVDKSTKSSRLFKALGLPTTFVVDRQGREVGRLVGPAQWDAPESVALLKFFIAQH